MRRVRYSVAMSLDGYIADTRGGYHWIVMDPDIDFGSIFSQFDTLLIGGNTYAGMAATGQGGGGGMTQGMRVLVFSHTLNPSDHPGVTVVRDRHREVVQELKEKPGKDIWLFGGGLLFRSLLAYGLVDSVEVAVVPVLLGGGVPLFPPPAGMTKLKLVKHHLYPKSGIMALEYAVGQEKAARRKVQRGRQ